MVKIDIRLKDTSINLVQAVGRKTPFFSNKYLILYGVFVLRPMSYSPKSILGVLTDNHHLLKDLMSSSIIKNQFSLY